MRISDWSSDVCSSDLHAGVLPDDDQCADAGGQSEDLAQSGAEPDGGRGRQCAEPARRTEADRPRQFQQPRAEMAAAVPASDDAENTDAGSIDRKSTRLNSSH